MEERRNNPDGKTRTQDNPQRKMFLETNISYEKELNRRQNTEQCTLGIGTHQSDIPGMVVIQPEHYNQPGQGHDRNQACQLRQPDAYLGA